MTSSSGEVLSELGVTVRLFALTVSLRAPCVEHLRQMAVTGV
ncbi:hypothetical protein [Microbacterium oleivorans]|nr:hypothetical protein [Microbacterium oleivorans]